MPIQAIHCNPPLAIARLGGSSVPMDAFSWSAGDDPHVIGESRAKPRWSLRVESDGSVTPVMPTTLTLKDNGQIRPVAPYIELWCDVGDDGDEGNWVRRPLTKSLLAANGLNAANVTFGVSATNLKVARRTGNPNHRYGTQLPVTVRGGEHQPKPLLAASLTTPGATRMIPAGRGIPLGSIQMILPGDQPPANAGVRWTEDVNIETIRLRITPAKGVFYGPPGSAQPVTPFSDSRGFSAVLPGNDFLDRDAGWAGATTERISVSVGERPQGLVTPGDTYDGAERSGGDDASLGIVDDTCEMEIRATLDQSAIGRPALVARANVFAGPPDYAPDRRPFLSLADSIVDRAAGNAERSAQLTDEELDRWVEDLFERAFETASLMNVDIWRRIRASELPAAKRRSTPIADDQTRDPARAFGGLDALRDEDIALPEPSLNVPLPVSERARERHRNLSDIVALKRFIREKPDRLDALIRQPYHSAAEEDGGATTMQMPPFMRNSNAQPLTLAVWQYELLMEWQRRVLAGPVTIEEEGGAPELTPAAAKRRAEVLRRLQNATGDF